MKRLRYFLLPAALFTLALHSSQTFAQVSGKFEDFTLTLTTPKTKYIQLQPIPIAITLKNETNGPLVGHNGLEFGTSFLHLYSTVYSGRFEIPVTLMKKYLVVSPREFRPGEQIEKTERLTYQLNRAFPDPGIYRVHALFLSHDGKESIVSKSVEVEIVPPEGLDAQALQFIRDHSEPAYFFTGVRAVKNPAQLQVLEKFVAVYGESSYGDEASFTLAEVQFAMRDYEKSRKIFERLSKNSDRTLAAEAAHFLKLIDQREQQKKARP